MEGIQDQSTNIKEVNEVDYSFEGGRKMASVEPGEEIVIAGISGAFPSSNNVHEFKENMFNKKDMVSPNVRWDMAHPEIPNRTGAIPAIDQYDHGFFGVHERQSDSMDAMTSMLMEKTVEAIFDAGLHPSDLENTKTGVYVGVCFSENDKTWFFDNLGSKNYAITGSERSMTAHRVSYFLKLKGPSLTTDTACSSSLYALEHACRSLRMGEIDNAIVAGTNLCLHPFVSLQFARLGVLSKDGSCKAFDENGDGYARSEAVGVLILQKAKNARRIYADIVHIKTNCDGYKEQGITFPSKDAQRTLLDEFYKECDVDRYSLDFLEAHGTGTFVGDPEECFAIDAVFTKNRKKPLLIGSVKSSIGHSEPASGVCSIIKCIIAMETGFIPPNIHFNAPKSDIKGLVDGRMKVVTEKTPLNNSGLIGINSFGFGGGNCHVLLKWNPKTKVNLKDNLPRLVCVSGRTKDAVLGLLDSVTNNSIIDIEYLNLLYNGFRKNVNNHWYRGYSIATSSGEIARSLNFLKYFPDNSSPLCLAFGELNNWYQIGRDLMVLPCFSESIQRVQKVLTCHQLNIADVLLKKSSPKKIGSLLGSVVIQMCLADLLNLLEVGSIHTVGYSFGELVAGYFKGVLTLEETINYTLVTSKTLSKIGGILESNNNNFPEGKVNCIINGNALKKDNVSNGHSFEDEVKRAMEYMKTSLQYENFSSMKDYLLHNVLESLNNGKDTKKITKFVNALFSNVYQNTEEMKSNSIIIKMGESPIDAFEDIPVISLFDGNMNNHLVNFLKGIGSLYELGYNPQISKLYPTAAFPVSRGTQMISPFLKWNHRKPKFFPRYTVEVADQATRGGRKVKIQINDFEWKYIVGHLIDGRNLFPAAGYLYLVWETLSMMNNVTPEVMRVCFENCKFIRATTVSQRGHFSLTISIQMGSGNFEVVEGDSAVVTGRIYLLGPHTDLKYPRQSRFSSDNQNTSCELNSKDVYKELRLRGYNYRGEFRAIENCNVFATSGNIRWENNWVTFIDNMFQMKIIQNDTRLLYVPTFISKIIVLGSQHMGLVNCELAKGEKNVILPVFNDFDSDTIRCGGIYISGLQATSIHRRKILGVPVLESYKFVPNFTVLDIYQSIRVNTQIILENSLSYKVKAVELIDESTDESLIPLTPIIKSALEDQPLIQPFLKILSRTTFENLNIEIEDKDLKNETDCLLVIASNILSRPDIMKIASTSLMENGFIMSRESHKYDTSKHIDPDFVVFTIHRTENETLLLLRKKSNIKTSKFIQISSSQELRWLPEVQKAITIEKHEDIVLYVKNEPKNGILGLVNCLRREPQSKLIRCMFMMDTVEDFNSEIPFYSNQLKKHMAINVYKNGQWGTYRHLLLERGNDVQSEHCFVNVTSRGDLSSLRWIEGPLMHNSKQSEKDLIQVYYCALNFRDIMTALGKITVDVVTRDRLAQECVQGFEFSGRDSRGNRVVGMISYGALSTLILGDKYLTFQIPDNWSFEEAATIPVVYGTVIYGLIMRGQMKRGESILIHSGTGGIGQAAIRIALHYGCRVFTTVGTKEKREFLKKTFPQLRDHHIGNSHDESFEQLVYKGTNGRGVDLVLNSLADEKLITSVRCLAKGGRFIEIGKYDMGVNTHVNLLLLQKEACFQGVMLDQMFSDPPQVKQELMKIMLDGIKYGAIKPLNRTIFKYNDIEQAFRFMATGKHKGKVLIQIRKPEKELVVQPPVTKFTGIARYFCDSEKVYIITGGLGGFGLELADWLILRGARKLVLVSRKGVTTGYQSYRLNLFKTYGAVVKISTAPITRRDGCKQLIEESLKLGNIDAIFNLAVVLADAVFENQSPENFISSFGPKAHATEYLDKLTRILCPDLSQFVVFSSVSCGRGNAGQTNYGMSNSIMERICEDRKRAGYPALAIEWGAIGEVGLVADMLEEDTEIEISGTLQQRISSCLHVMDTLLRQSESPIVSSMVVAEKRALTAADNVVDAVINILGLNDSKSVSLHSTLAELGMDSMTAVEIKQVLERDFEVFLTAKDIRTMTLAKLKDIQNEKLCEENKDNVAYFGIEMVIRLYGNESHNYLPYVEMESKVPQDVKAPTLLAFPGIEGVITIFQDLAKQLNAHIVGIQLNMESNEKTVLEMAQSVIPTVEKFISNNEFILMSYSFGVLIALEVANILESRGYRGTIISIDGAPILMKQMALNLGAESEKTLFETKLICHLLSFYVSFEVIGKHKEKIFKCATWEDRVKLGAELVKHRSVLEENYQRLVANSIYDRTMAVLNYTPSYNKLKSNLKLFKPTQTSVLGLAEDYELSQYFEKPIEIKTIQGNHATILENEGLVTIINSYISENI